VAERRVTLEAKVLTVSDGVVGGTREDRSGQALVDRLGEAGFASSTGGSPPTASARSRTRWRS